MGERGRSSDKGTMGGSLAWFLTGLFVLISFSTSVGQESLPAIVKKTEPSTVVIRTYDKEGNVRGQGTGFFISSGGDVITNHHVLQGAEFAAVKTSEGKIYPVKKILSDDKEGDLVRVSVDTLGDVTRPLLLATSLPEVGERVVVIGSPLGLEKTVSDGIVSALREVPRFGKIIQITAPISPGSSGSPVVNMKGEVVGVISFFAAPGQNLNFAIPGERIAGLKSEDGRTLSEWNEGGMEELGAQVVQIYAMGMRYLLIENYEQAIVFFGEVIKRDPNHAIAYFQFGYCKGKLGLYSEAIEAYQQALRLKPDDADTHNNLCVAYNKVGRFVEAVESCKRALAINPNLADTYSNLAWSYHKLGRYAEAIESCRQAIRIQPNDALAHYNLGNSLSALGRYPEAIDSYKQTIRLMPDHAEAHMNLGAAQHQLGRYEEALESYKQAVRLKPDLVEGHLNLGMTYLRLGDRGSALDEYKILMKLNGDAANKLFNLIYE